MRAAVFNRYRGPITIRDVPVPEPGVGEVRVRVEAASVNSWDWDKYSGALLSRFEGVFTPGHRILGGDVAGVVEAVGEGVTDLKAGDGVAGDLSSHGWGGFAEYVAAPAAAFVPVPEGVAFEQAAAVPQAGTLALQALRMGAPVKAGDRVLVNGAGGGMGTFAIQLAKSMGAHVTAIDHGSKLDLMRALGADEVADYTQSDYTRAGQRYDRIIEPVGRHGTDTYRNCLNEGGTFALVGGTPMSILRIGAFGRKAKDADDTRTLGMLFWEPVPADMSYLLELCASGALRAVIDTVYRLDDTAAALRHVGEGRARGKVLVRPSA